MKIPEMPDDRTLVKPTEKRVSKGGIILPNSVTGISALRGTVMAVGPDCKRAKVGDDVSFAIYSKYVVPEDEGPYKDWLLINEPDILIYWVEEKESDNGET